MSHRFHIYYRRLPHWRKDHATYFVTWRLHPLQTELAPEERTLIVAALRHFDASKYILIAFVVMNDHVHVLLHMSAGISLGKVVHGWKSYTARLLQREYHRRGRVWQPEYFDRIVRSEMELEEKVHYILSNPWKRWPTIDRYPWVGVRDE